MRWIRSANASFFSKFFGLGFSAYKKFCAFLRKITTFPLAPAKKKAFQPAVEQLEVLILPATYTWDGGAGPTDLSWNTAANWSSNTVPTATDGAILGSGATVHLASNVTITSLTISAASLFLESYSLTVTGSGSDWTSGDLHEGTLNIASGATFTISNDAHYLNDVTILNEGDLIWTGDDTISGYSGDNLIQNEGIFDIQGDGTLGGYLDVLNTGTGSITKSDSAPGATTIATSGTFDNDGAFEVQVGTFILSSSAGTSSGTFAVAEDAVLTFSSAHSFTGTPVISGAGALNVYGTLAVDGALNLSIAEVYLAGGGLDGATITVTEAMTWSSGTLYGEGALEIAPGAVLTISTNNTHYLNDGFTILNRGQILWLDNGIISGSGEGNLIQNEGLIDIQGDGYVQNYLTILNTSTGTITKSDSDSGTTTIGSGAVLNNYGSIHIEQSILSIAEGLNPGKVLVDPDMVLTYNSETYTLSDTATAAFMAQGGYTYAATQYSDGYAQMLAAFRDPAGPSALEAYEAMVDWGDDSEDTEGILMPDASVNGFAVFAGHTYAGSGPFIITITISHDTAGDVIVHSFAQVQAAPAAPEIVSISTDTGESDSDGITTDTTLTLAGTAPDDATVKIYKGGNYLGTTTADGSGDWTYNTTLTEGTFSFTATATVDDETSDFSATFLVTVDASDPEITLVVPEETTSFEPEIVVYATDEGGLSDGATVSIDVDLDGDHDFEGGELGYASGTLFEGYAVITLSGLDIDTFDIRATVTDLAGNEVTSDAETMEIIAVADPWEAGDGVVTVDAGNGNTLQMMGGVRLVHALDLDISPGSSQSDSPSLVYNSHLTQVRPVVQTTLQLDNSAALPGTITVTLTWDDNEQDPVEFSTTGIAQGDLVTLAVQVDDPVAATGRYAWSLNIEIPGEDDVPLSGVAYVRVEDDSPFGAGWTFSNLNRLIEFEADDDGPAGVLWLYGTGDVRFFEDAGGGDYTSPADVNGILVKNGGDDFTYTTPENVKLQFNSSGYQTETVSGDGFTSVLYAYTDGRLSGIEARDHATTTLSYTDGLIVSIATAGSRSWGFDHTDDDLTQITDPDARTRVFAIDGTHAHHVTGDVRGDVEMHWGYDSHGLVNEITWGNGSSPTVTEIVPVAALGLEDLFIGSLVSTATDALGNTTFYVLDSKGRELQRTDPDGAVHTWTRDAAGRVTHYIDPLSRETVWTRDAQGYVTAVAYPGSGGEIYDYSEDEFHFLLSYTDANNNTTSYEPDAFGRVATMTDALLNDTLYVYNETTGLLASIEDPMGRFTYLTYDLNRRQETLVTVLGTTTYTFDETTGEINSVQDANLHLTEMAFDEMGRMTGRTTPDEFSEVWVYNDAGMLLSYTDKAETVTLNGYDGYGRGLVINVVQTAPGLGRSRQIEYDDLGRAVASSDFLNNWTTFTLDSMGRSIKVNDAQQNATRNTFDRAGQLIRVESAMGGMTKYLYNDRGWVIQTTDARGKEWLTEFDDMGQVIGTTAPGVTPTATVYDELNRLYSYFDGVSTVYTTYWDDGRVKTEQDGEGNITYTEYNLEENEIYITYAQGSDVEETITQTIDAVGNVISVTDALTHTMTYTLDEMDRVESWEDELGHGDSYEFGPWGQVKKITDELGKQTNFTLDGFGRTVKSEDAEGVTSKTVFDANDQALASLDDDNDASRSIYDKLGQLVVSIDPNGGRTRYQYNANGWLIAYVDPLGNKTSWEYDAAGNKVKETDQRGNSRTWQYDDAGRLEIYTDKLGRKKLYTYYANGQVATEVWKDAGNNTVNTINYSYNLNGMLLSISDDSGSFAWTYDELNRLETTTDTWDLSILRTYDDADRLDVVTDDLGGEMTYHWDDADRLDSKEFDDGATQFSMGFGYNNRNDLTEINRYDDSETLVSKTNFGHDDARRVESITHKNGSNVTVDSFDYIHDDEGQIEQETSTLGPTKNYTHDRAGQIESDSEGTYDWDANGNNAEHTIEARNELASDGVWDYFYDDEGNLTDKEKIIGGERWHYGYDNNNRLVLAEHKPDALSAVDLRVQMGYDPVGNRISKSVDADGDGGGSAVVAKFAIDEYGNAWADLNASEELLMRRIYLDAVDALYGRIDAGTGDIDYYLTDILASVRDIVDKEGTLFDHRDWTSFGVLDNETGSGSDRYGWTGREYDAEIDLQYNRARYYDANTSRWISQDPLGFDAGDSNLYRYVNNRPTSVTDPSGLTPDWEVPPGGCDGKCFQGPAIVVRQNDKGLYEVKGKDKLYKNLHEVISDHPFVQTVIDMSTAPTHPIPTDEICLPVQQVIDRFTGLQTNAPNGVSWLMEEFGQRGHREGSWVDNTLHSKTHSHGITVGIPANPYLDGKSPIALPVNAVEIWAHGTADGMRGLSLQRPDDAKILGRFLKGLNWNVKGGGIIILSGCNVGLQKQNSFAQIIADESGRAVYASMGYLSGSVLRGQNVFISRQSWIRTPISGVGVYARGGYRPDATTFGSQDGLYRVFIPKTR